MRINIEKILLGLTGLLRKPVTKIEPRGLELNRCWTASKGRAETETSRTGGARAQGWLSTASLPPPGRSGSHPSTSFDFSSLPGRPRITHEAPQCGKSPGPRHTCYNPRSPLTCSEHQLCPQLKRQALRGARLIYPSYCRTRCALLCAWIYTLYHAQKSKNPSSLSPVSQEIPVTRLFQLIRRLCMNLWGLGGYVEHRTTFFFCSRKDIAPLSASQRPTPSSLCLPFPPARTGFPVRSLLQRGVGGGMAAPACPGWGDTERPCGSGWGGIAAPFRGRVFPTVLVVFKAPELEGDRRGKEPSSGGGRRSPIRPIHTQKWLPPPPSPWQAEHTPSSPPTFPEPGQR